MSNLVKKGVSLLQISTLLTSIFAFCFVINLAVSVCGKSDEEDKGPYGTGEIGEQFYGVKGSETPEVSGKIGLGGLLQLLFPKTDLSKSLGYTAGHLVQGLSWAMTIFGVLQLVKAMGLDKNIANSLSYGAVAGIMAGKVAKVLFWKATKSAWPTVIGVGVGLLVFALTYKKESKKIVEFTCQPWQAPIGGADCEKCNQDPFKPCSDYRCRSLGQACQLLNAGTKEERCTWVNPLDVNSPTIEPWQDALTKDHSYQDVKIRPPGIGMRIANDRSTDKCIKAFTPLQFGVVTNEPSQCKIDYNHTQKFDDMQYWFGETNLFSYNHSQRLSLPGPSAINSQAPELENDGVYTLYVRCQDANGNYNTDEFAIRFCVEKGPDTTQPRIEKTSIENGMPVSYNTEEINLDVYINEPANCKWSRNDMEYDLMENEMSCSENLWEMQADLVYKCSGKLTGIKNYIDNIFYFRCKDQPWGNEADRNFNTQSYKFIIKGTQQLNIIETEPNGTIQGSTDVVSVTIKVETANGYNEGDATCYYSTTDNEADYIKFFETGTNLHNQQQDLTSGDYTYYFKCVDLGGNTDYDKTTFTLKIDKQAPEVVRAYKDGSQLKIITDEKSTCRYSSQDCNFNIGEGINMPYANETEHFTEWQATKTYYVKCSDLYNNQPLPTECSIILKVYDRD